jgi:hypothetical protein
MTRRLLLCGTWMLALAAAASAEGPLATLPSPAGQHIAKIKALADDTWLNLGPPAADPTWGKARGRSWTPKMPLACDLRAAFLYGEGVHAYMKPDGRLMDDLWAYDVNAHRWICLHPGTSVKEPGVTLDPRGFTVRADGKPVPIAQMGHGYEGMTYDSDRRAFVFVPCESPYSRDRLKPRLPLPGADLDRKRIRTCPWSFDLATGVWDRHLTEGPYPGGTNMESVVQYVPSKKQVFFVHVREPWFYDPARHAWTKADAKGPPPPFGIDAVACHDTRRDRIYLGGGSYPTANALWIYDVKSNTWIDPQPTRQPGKGNPNYAGGYATMQYDEANDAVVLILYRAPAERRGIYVYDPAANRWSVEPRPLPKELTERKNLNAFYDPELNVHFFHAAGDSDDDGTIWVYRLATKK